MLTNHGVIYSSDQQMIALNHPQIPSNPYIPIYQPQSQSSMIQSAITDSSNMSNPQQSSNFVNQSTHITQQSRTQENGSLDTDSNFNNVQRNTPPPPQPISNTSPITILPTSMDTS